MFKSRLLITTNSNRRPKGHLLTRRELLPSPPWPLLSTQPLLPPGFTNYTRLFTRGIWLTKQLDIDRPSKPTTVIFNTLTSQSWPRLGFINFTWLFIHGIQQRSASTPPGPRSQPLWGITPRRCHHTTPGLSRHHRHHLSNPTATSIPLQSPPWSRFLDTPSGQINRNIQLPAYLLHLIPCRHHCHLSNQCILTQINPPPLPRSVNTYIKSHQRLSIYPVTSAKVTQRNQSTLGTTLTPNRFRDDQQLKSTFSQMF